MLKKTLIAQVAHEIIRGYSAGIGDTPAPPWAETTKAQRAGLEAGVDLHLAHPDTTPETAHESWLADKLANGWKIGPKRDDKKKLHPNLLPYAELDPLQKAKDYVFRSAVHALAALPDPEQVEKLVEKRVDVPVDMSKVTAAEIYKAMGEAARSAMAALIVADSPKQAPPSIAPTVPAGYVAVQYIGARPVWKDRNYGSGMTFVLEQTRHVPPLIARHLLRHADLFAPGNVADAEAESAPSVDSTEAELDQAARERAESQRLQNERQDLVDRVQQMDPAALVEHASTNYRQPLDASKPVEALRTEVIRMIDQFGVV